MKDHLGKSFGLTIAFLIPGMVALYALAYFMPELRTWFGLVSERPTTVGGFLFVVVGSFGVGVIVSGVRWFLCDRFLAPQVSLNTQRRREGETEAAYQALIANHYQYYQFYANTSVALAWLFLCWLIANDPGWAAALQRLVFLAVAAGALLLFAHDAMKKFNRKALQLLGSPQRETSA